jgi:hypothetical protein
MLGSLGNLKALPPTFTYLIQLFNSAASRQILEDLIFYFSGQAVDPFYIDGAWIII